MSKTGCPHPTPLFPVEQTREETASRRLDPRVLVVTSALTSADVRLTSGHLTKLTELWEV
jgi:hypothetical protein